MAAGVCEFDRVPLVHRVQAGDREAFDALVDMYWDPVMRFFWKRIPVEDAEDLAQEVFVTVYRVIRRGDGPNLSDEIAWKRYLFKCARNRVIDYWRRKAVKPPMEALADMVGEEQSWESTHFPGTDKVHVPGTAISSEQSTAIRDCMGQLDVAARAACWLVFVDRKSKREIARMMDRPESTVRQLIGEAIRMLRLCLEGKGMAPE